MTKPSMACNSDGHAETGLLPVGRFAPSPSGRMHAGNLFAALLAWLDVKSRGGKIILRIEDIDTQRCRAEYIDALQRDLEYFGLCWDEGPYFQSKRGEAYEEALGALEQKGLLYPCYCSRADLHAASAPHTGEDWVYPGTCRPPESSVRQGTVLQSPPGTGLKSPSGTGLKAKAFGPVPNVLSLKPARNPSIRIIVPDQIIGFSDALQGECAQNLKAECGDFILRRSDGGFAYQLAVVIDDAAMGVNSILRAVDLLDSTPRQIYLQRLLGFSEPQYCHIPLLVDSQGRRLSKRQKDASLDVLLQRFGNPEQLIGFLAGLAGLVVQGEALSAAELLPLYNRQALLGQTHILWP